jgi:hypothetical protein
LAAALLPGSRVEVLYGDADEANIEQLHPELNEWAIDRLRVISPRLAEPFEWIGRAVLSDDQLRFVRSPDLSAIDQQLPTQTLSGSCLKHGVSSNG